MRASIGKRACGRALALLGGLALIASAPASAAVTGTTGTWQVQKSPNLTLPSGQINAMSCTSATACTAVGDYLNARGLNATLAERWDGASWKLQPARSPAGAKAPGLNGVSCVSATFCEAVGVSSEAQWTGDAGFAEVWRGKGWSLQSVPAPAGATTVQLKAVSCASADFCEAVGAYMGSSSAILSLAERWNGSKWTLQKTPNQSGAAPTELDGVSCVSASLCQAVDFYGPMAEKWNGKFWAARAVPYPSGMTSVSVDAVSCPSPTSCEAVGTYDNPNVSNSQTLFAAVWKGYSWHSQVMANPKTMDRVMTSVSCVSADLCEAVGYHEVYASGVDTFRAMAEGWDGTAWRLQKPTSASGTAMTLLSGVSCASAGFCEAGGYLPARIEAWNGTSWKTQRAVVPRAATSNSLAGVSCVSATFCAAVGDASGASSALAELWDGSAWQIQRKTAASPLLLLGVSCVSATFCEAVGSSGSGEAAQAWTGSAWQAQQTPGTEYTAVSCVTQSFCVAVGPSGAAGWDGTSWSAASLPAIPSPGYYTGVSCVSETACEAVGWSTATGASYAADWNGASWTAQAVPSPAGARAAALRHVSCAAADSCEAVGAAAGVGAFAESWNGTAWTVQTVPVPAGAAGDILNGVSCTAADACAAAGSGYWAGQGYLTLILTWDGTSWSIQPTPNPAAANDTLNAVSCVPAGPCVAVGQAPDAGGYYSTLAEANS